MVTHGFVAGDLDSDAVLGLKDSPSRPFREGSTDEAPDEKPTLKRLDPNKT